MSQSISTGNQSCPIDPTEHSTEEAVSILAEIVQDQQEVISQLTTTVAELQDDQAEHEEEQAELRSDVEQLQDDQAEHEEERAELRSDVEQLQDDVDDQPAVGVDDESDPLGSLTINVGDRDLPLGRALRSKVTETDVSELIDEHDARQAGDSESNPKGRNAESRVQTPLERVCALPEASVETNLTANQRRARFVAAGIRDYSRTVPAGYAIRSSEIRRVLSASEESSIHTQTVARVMDYLADLGGNDVSIKTTRSGERTVVFSESIVSRITHVVTDNTDGPVIESTA